jgi:enoyl-CoA hydratase/carnithine racemase
MAEEVILQIDGKSALVTINRPEARNSLTKGVVKRIAEVVNQCAKDEKVRCVILRGAGGHFCAGADLKKTLMEDPDLLENLDSYMDAYHSVIRAIVRCPKPTIAMLEGCAVGFGADMAFACDLRVASTTAYVQEKFVRIGLMPDGGGSFWLPRLVGTARAMKMMYLAEKIVAEEMHALGLLTNLVPEGELRSATMNLARELEAGPALAYANLKRAVYANLGDLEGALTREREGQLELLRSQDAMEGIMAFAQKRAPHFTGK